VEVEVEPEVDRIEWVDDEAGDAPQPQAATAPPPPPTAPVAEFDPDLHLDEPAPAPAAAKPAPRPVATQKPASTTTKPVPKPRTAAKVETVPEPEIREPLTARLLRHKTALVAVALVAVIGLTVANRLWRKRLTELPEIYERGRTEGLAALDAGNFPVAKELLRAASAAAQQLGGDFDEDKEKVVQGALEAAIYADLASVSLEELIEKRARAKSPEEWNTTFETYYKGQSFVVVSHIAAEPDPARPESGYDLDLRLAYGSSSTPAGRGRLDLKGFTLLEEAKPKKGEIVSFGARLAGVELDTVRGEWLVKVEPDSGVFLRHAAAWGVLGFPAADETEEPTK
jgi:hypothetical protein